MLRASIAFFVLAILAYFFGAYGVAGLSMEVGRLLLWIFLVVAAVTLVVSLLSGRKPKSLL